MASLHFLKRAEPATADETEPEDLDEWAPAPAAQPVPLSPYRN
jgi:hypothetical protein